MDGAGAGASTCWKRCHRPLTWSTAISTHTQTKAKYYASLAQYNRSLADTTAGKHGEALARLGAADAAAKEAYRYAMTFGSSFYVPTAASAASTLPADAANSLQELTKAHMTIVAEAKKSGTKDNDLIYHDVVPSEATLSAIDKAANVAEPTPIQEIYASPEVQKLVGQDIFIKLVPLSVIESSSLYSEEKAKILRTEGEKCEIADGELVTGLEHLGLPGSLAKFRGQQTEVGASALADPGGQVKGYASEIRSEERSKRIETYITELSSLRDKANADLEYCSRELDQEQRECEQARVRFDHLFEQSPSGSHTRAWRTDIKNDREALKQARVSDDQVLGLWGGAREDIAVLAGSEEGLEQVFAENIAKADATANGNANNLLDFDIPEDDSAKISQQVSVIEEALSKLQKLKKERADVLADLKERVHNDDISQLLIINRKTANVEPTLFAAELEKFRPHQARLAAACQAQEQSMQLVQSTFAQLTSGKKGKEIQNRWAKADRARKDLQARFKRAYDAYREIRNGVTKGMEFYRELSNLLSQIRSEVAQFVSSRARERSQMVSAAELKQRLSSSSSSHAGNLDRSFDSMSLSSRSAPPPPQPAAAPSHYPSLSSQPQSSYSAFSPTPPPSQPPVSTYSNYPPAPTASPYGAPSTPSLPPKPPSQSQYQPYRQQSTGALPPPPSQQQYSHSPVPPPPSQPTYSSPPPPSSYASPPPPSHSSYPSYPSYPQQPSVPPRPPTHSSPAPPPQSGYGAPSPQAYGQYPQAYGQPPAQPHQPNPYGQQPPYQPVRHDSGGYAPPFSTGTPPASAATSAVWTISATAALSWLSAAAEVLSTVVI